MDGPNCSLNDYDTLAYDELRRLRRPRGFAKKAVLKTRLSTNARETQEEMTDASGKRNRVNFTWPP